MNNIFYKNVTVNKVEFPENKLFSIFSAKFFENLVAA